jgi:uncharacterized NAD(P)/FAD-binding protein YdhS
MMNETPLMCIHITIVGSGEPLLRLQKRLTCAAKALHLKLDIEVRKDYEDFAIAYEQTPAVFMDGLMALSGLPRTEEIESWLRSLVKTNFEHHTRSITCPIQNS